MYFNNLFPIRKRSSQFSTTLHITICFCYTVNIIPKNYQSGDTGCTDTLRLCTRHQSAQCFEAIRLSAANLSSSEYFPRPTVGAICFTYHNLLLSGVLPLHYSFYHGMK